jgi:hypothetical protein
MNLFVDPLVNGHGSLRAELTKRESSVTVVGKIRSPNEPFISVLSDTFAKDGYVLARITGGGRCDDIPHSSPLIA